MGRLRDRPRPAQAPGGRAVMDAEHVIRAFTALGVTLRLGAGGCIVSEADRGLPDELKTHAQAVRGSLAALLANRQVVVPSANGHQAIDDAEPPLTDRGNAERFAAEHRGWVRYQPDILKAYL